MVSNDEQDYIFYILWGEQCILHMNSTDNTFLLTVDLKIFYKKKLTCNTSKKIKILKKQGVLVAKPKYKTVEQK